ncbi:MAG: CoA ester lyase, partial [Chloroflexi bacterium]|nr:CoA ester lyase [Chloroflexota bacterium]
MQPYRSLLFVPAHKPDWVTKALRAAPDAIILDLEDAVPDESKVRARELLADEIQEIRETAAHVGAVVRLNSWPSEHAPAEVEAALVADADVLMIPKVDTADELDRLAAVLGYEERRTGVEEGRTALLATLESAQGLLNTDKIAAAPRVGGVLAAAARDGDTARSIGFRWTPTGEETLAFRSRTVLACRAAGDRHPVVGLWQDVKDLEGLRRFAE